MARGALILFAGFLVFIFLSFPADANLYQWTDENGKTHFTDDKTKIPQKYLQQNKERSSNKQKMVICEKELEFGLDREINWHNDSIAFLEKKIKATLKGKQGRSERIQKLSEQNILAKKRIKERLIRCKGEFKKSREFRKLGDPADLFREEKRLHVIECENFSDQELRTLNAREKRHKKRLEMELNESEKSIEVYSKDLEKRREQLELIYEKFQCKEK